MPEEHPVEVEDRAARCSEPEGGSRSPTSHCVAVSRQLGIARETIYRWVGRGDGDPGSDAVLPRPGSLLRLARSERGWSQRQLADAARVPVSTVARIESANRQPSLLFRLPPAADRELGFDLAPHDDHDDVLDEPSLPGRGLRRPPASPAADSDLGRDHPVLVAGEQALTPWTS